MVLQHLKIKIDLLFVKVGLRRSVLLSSAIASKAQDQSMCFVHKVNIGLPNMCNNFGMPV